MPSLPALTRPMAQEPPHRIDRDAELTRRMRSKTASTVSASRPTPSSVPTSARDRLGSAEHEMGRPFNVAPRPRTASNISPNTGLNTTPTSTRRLTANPMHTHCAGAGAAAQRAGCEAARSRSVAHARLTTKGKEWTKFVVPSSGSTSHVGSSVSSARVEGCPATDGMERTRTRSRVQTAVIMLAYQVCSPALLLAPPQ